MPATTDPAPTPSGQPGHAHCLICGSEDPLSLGLKFVADDSGAVTSQFQAHCGLQGYDGFLHGGVISALLDSAMWHCLLEQNIQAWTGELHVRYRKPVPLSTVMELKARIVSSRPPLYRTEAELTYKHIVMAMAKGTFMRLPRR
jgi:acyl-coenzyme A thioesterase PaaI-like protein